MTNYDDFELSRKLYPGIKKGLDTEYANFIYRSTHPLPGHTRFKVSDVLPKLKTAVELQINWRNTAKGDFRPAWKNFSTWINQLCWQEEMPGIRKAPVDKCHYDGCNDEWTGTHKNKKYCRTHLKIARGW